MKMHILSFSLVLALIATTTTADILKPRNWDLRLLQPGCQPNNSNIDLSVYHSSGVSARDCTDLTSLPDLNLSMVDTVSWKSPSEPGYDLCTYRTGDCDAEGAEAIRGGWKVCVKYTGWQGWKAVARGEDCD
ncbi:hypothetical protein BDV28DRAFT_146416 [Aspergillus coremiiformis]|uniref:Uncharacterized protein n=1 Tax=Aspergillus coremiiformis TaxID=138285 RepID=A0A5N6ZBY2_9EURO|nr:hypothetical protein BDV28DRAFT_146416 [Aspergillus coremiiformis]